MNWKYVKALDDWETVEEFETAVGYVFPKEFKDCISAHNGGKPAECCFVIPGGKEQCIKTFLSFNKHDHETIWKVREWNAAELGDKYICFAVDDSGNLICFDKKSSAVIFLELESLTAYAAADSFEEFLASLKLPD